MTSPTRILPVPSLDAAIALLGRGGRRGILSMVGESMRPTLAPGERVLVEFETRRLERGDLVLYRQVDYLVVHRVLGPASRDVEPALRTRGDGASSLDPPLDPSRIRGRVRAIERDGTWYLLDSGAARAWALGVALHDLAWASLAGLATVVDRGLARVGLATRVAAMAAACDRALLGVAHRLLFRRLHRTSGDVPL